MLGKKDKFVAALNLLPDGIEELRNVVIPNFTIVSVPADVDEAIIAQGILAHNINDLLSTFSGLKPVELLLRIGQVNEVLQGMLLAALQNKAATVHDFRITSPQTAPAAYYQKSDPVQFRAIGEGDNPNDLIGVDVLLSANDQLFSLARQSGEVGVFWKEVVVELPIARMLSRAGGLPPDFPIEVTATFSPTYRNTDFTQSKEIIFSIIDDV